MGVIQNAINQMLGTAGIAARLSPEYETKQELHKLGKQETALSLQQESLPTLDPKEFEEGKTIAAKQHQEILKKQAEVAQRQFELNPTKETMRKATFARSGAGEGPLFTIPADPEEIMMEQANLQAAQRSETRQLQKRNFKDYLSRIDPIYDKLGPKAQKIVQQSYSKGERKRIMDTLDKEKKDGNNK